MSGTPMHEVIAMAVAEEAIAPEVGTQLTARIGDKLLTEIPHIRYDLARVLGDMPGALAAAKALLDFMREVELIDLPGAQTVPTVAPPPVVNVVIPPKLAEMTLQELLAELAKNPDNADEIISHLRAKIVVRDAERKLGNTGLWVIQNPDGSLNVTETMAYLRYLVDPRTLVSQRWTGSTGTYVPVTLNHLLGNGGKFLIYPWPERPDQVLFRGVDPFGKDWRTLKPVVRQALLWGLGTGRISAFTPDEIRRVTFDLFTNPLPDWLQSVVDEYTVVRDRDGVTVPDEMTVAEFNAHGIADRVRAASRRPFGDAVPPVRDNKWYKDQLIAMAQQAANISGSSFRRRRTIIRSVDVSGGDADLDGVIVLRDVTVMGGDLYGTVYLPEAFSADVLGGSNQADVFNCSWEQLYNRAVEWGIIQKS